MSVQTLSNMTTETLPEASSPSSAQDTQQALPCNTHTATQSKPYSPCPRKSTPSPHFLQKTTTKIMQPWHCSRAGGCVSPSRSCKGFSSWLAQGSGACCNIPALTALLFSGAKVAALPGHTWLAQPEGSLFSTIRLQSLCMWRGIACARYWGFLAAVAAHPTHCLWCMLSKQSPGSS